MNFSIYFLVWYYCYPLSSDDSENTQCTALCSRQGTSDTIEEQNIVGESPQCGDQRTSTELPEPSAIQRCSSEVQTLKGGLTPEWDTVLASEQATWPQLSRFPSEADIPPSYSKATGLDSVCEEAAHTEEKKLRINAPENSTLPSLSHELTASELLRNRWEKAHCQFFISLLHTVGFVELSQGVPEMEIINCKLANNIFSTEET